LAKNYFPKIAWDTAEIEFLNLPCRFGTHCWIMRGYPWETRSMVGYESDIEVKMQRLFETLV